MAVGFVSINPLSVGVLRLTMTSLRRSHAEAGFNPLLVGALGLTRSSRRFGISSLTGFNPLPVGALGLISISQRKKIQPLVLIPCREGFPKHKIGLVSRSQFMN
jgi:hypothetical protein